MLFGDKDVACRRGMTFEEFLAGLTAIRGHDADIF